MIQSEDHNQQPMPSSTEFSMKDSCLFTQPETNMETGGNAFNMSESLLFKDVIHDYETNELSKTNQTNLQDLIAPQKDLEPNQESLKQDSQELVVVDFDDMDQDFSPASKPSKTVKLFSGKQIKLAPRSTERVNIDEKQLSGIFLDMDSLTNKANLRNSFKENRKKLSDPPSLSSIKHDSTSSQIWTEKYKPNSFIQLCSAGNDRQYRLILQWLKKWSPVVFGDDILNTENSDPLGRPYKKILLIHGPTGIGKTTISHILAKHMGYTVQELNAANSMDTLPQASGGGSTAYTNAASALKLKIVNALTSNSIHSQGKPSCLIIDEIDSLANINDVVKVLNDLVQADHRALNKKLKRLSTEEIEAKKKSKKKDIFLNRPIICIANDIYSQQSNRFGPNPMEKLRPISEIIQFRKPTTSKTSSGAKTGGNAIKSVKDYLMQINKQENMGLDHQEIGDIVEICEGDIRACINHMQFNSRIVDTIERRISKDTHLIDRQLSWFAMTDQLFKRDPQLSKEENLARLFDGFMNGEGRALASNSGTFDRVLKGIFDKYLDTVHIQDDSLIKPCELSDWISYQSRFTRINETNEYSPLVLLKASSLFSDIRVQPGNQTLILNAKNLDFEHSQLLKSNKNIIRLIENRLLVQMRVALGMNAENAASLVLPCLAKILSPHMSAKVKSDLNVTEKKCLERIAGLVKELDLSLEYLKDLETGLSSLKLNPDLDLLTIYDNYLTTIPAASVVKQIQLRRQSLFPLITAELDRIDVSKKSVKRSLEENTKESNNGDKAAKRSKTLATTSLNFFKGRYEEVNSKTHTANTDEGSSDGDKEFKTSRIWVKYNEGFSNAVRKNIGWNDLWIV